MASRQEIMQAERKQQRVFCAYRLIGYEDDGVSGYQCMDCKNKFSFADDPAFYNFCPKCGRSWFGKFECRNHNIPRWAYDRYGNEPPYEVKMYPDYKRPTRFFVIEEKCLWIRDGVTDDPDTRDWHHCSRAEMRLGAWKDAAYHLGRAMADNREYDEGLEQHFKYLYRVRIVTAT